MIKRLRIWWMYWRYRNITRRWQLLKPRLRHQPRVRATPRARGTAMYMPMRGTSHARGLIFVAVAAAVLAFVNALVGAYAPSVPHFWLDVVLFAVMAFFYMQYSHIL